MRTDDQAIYAQVNKGRKCGRQQKEINLFNTSSDSSRETEGDNISVETPLVTSEDGRSSTNSEESKYNGVKRIKYDDRESRV